MSFEKKLEDLEKIVFKMEEGKLSLEDSLKQFEKAVKLSKDCQEQLNTAEIKIQQLMSVDSDGQAVVKDI